MIVKKSFLFPLKPPTPSAIGFERVPEPAVRRVLIKASLDTVTSELAWRFADSFHKSALTPELEKAVVAELEKQFAAYQKKPKRKRPQLKE